MAGTLLDVEVIQMSGGSYQHWYDRVDSWPLEDDLREMLKDIFKIVEWTESGDHSQGTGMLLCYERVKKYLDGR